MVNIFSKNDVRYIGRFIPLYFVIFMGLLGLQEKKKEQNGTFIFFILFV